ncbi:pphln1 [Pungitius sinensis]
MDSREVTLHRVVNIVDKRSPMPRVQVGYDRSFDNDQWYGGPRNYHDAREPYGDGGFAPNDRRYFDDSPPCNFRRNISQNEGPSSQQWYGRDDLRHQLGSRKSGGSGPPFRSRGRKSGPPRRSPPPVADKRGRSPSRRAARPPEPDRSGSNSSSRSFSPDRERGFPPQQQQQQQRHLPSVLMSPVEESTHSSGSSKENAAVSVAEKEEEEAAGVEPKPTPEEVLKTRRSEAIKAKALEIETQYRKDCETFRTVVKMLVTKEPGLDDLLQAPLDENLLEIKERCLDALRQFVKELDEILKQPEPSA